MSDPTDYATDDQLFAEAKLAEQIKRERRARETPSGVTDCADCGDEIPAARRESLPYVTRCVSCQEQADRHRLQHRR